MTIAVLPGRMRALVEPLLPDWVEPRWWGSPEELVALAPQAEVGWFDLHEKPPVLASVAAAGGLRWLNTAYAGVNWLPLADLERRGVALTCGRGLTATAVAEFAVMTMLAVAKDYPAVVRAQDRGEWLHDAPGTRELAGSKALILGQGAIGQAIDRMLQGFVVETAVVRRNSGLGWKARLGEFDWIVLALPGTAETRGLIGAAELAAMKPETIFVNFARANIVDEAALIEALRDKRIAAAVLDVTDPEPLPPGHPLWSLPNAHLTMHLSGIPTPASLLRAAERFARNCARYRKGEPLEAQVDLKLGY
ncbi:MAG: D-2-hydroxyacid dehydrogenase [Croceibacterium sp.]